MSNSYGDGWPLPKLDESSKDPIEEQLEARLSWISACGVPPNEEPVLRFADELAHECAALRRLCAALCEDESALAIFGHRLEFRVKAAANGEEVRP